MMVIITSIEADLVVGLRPKSSTLNNFALPLKYMLYIYYSVQIKKDKAKIQALLDSGNKINLMTLVYAAKLGPKVRSTNVGIQKINNFTFETFEMILASF